MCFTTNYRVPLAFSWDALEAAQNALKNLYSAISNLKEKNVVPAANLADGAKKYQEKFLAAINDDLNMPQALAVVWEILKDAALADEAKFGALLNFDRVLGFRLKDVKAEVIPEEIKKLAQERETARLAKDFARSDELRKKISDLGYSVKDTQAGPKVKKNNQSCG